MSRYEPLSLNIKKGNIEIAIRILILKIDENAEITILY